MCTVHKSSSFAESFTANRLLLMPGQAMAIGRAFGRTVRTKGQHSWSTCFLTSWGKSQLSVMKIQSIPFVSVLLIIACSHRCLVVSQQAALSFCTRQRRHLAVVCNIWSMIHCLKTKGVCEILMLTVLKVEPGWHVGIVTGPCGCHENSVTSDNGANLFLIWSIVQIAEAGMIVLIAHCKNKWQQIDRSGRQGWWNERDPFPNLFM